MLRMTVRRFEQRMLRFGMQRLTLTIRISAALKLWSYNSSTRQCHGLPIKEPVLFVYGATTSRDTVDWTDRPDRARYAIYGNLEA